MQLEEAQPNVKEGSRFLNYDHLGQCAESRDIITNLFLVLGWLQPIVAQMGPV